MKFSFQRLDKVRALIMILSFILALLTTAGAAISVRSAATARATLEGAGNMDGGMPKIVIKNSPMTRADYQVLADRIRVLYPKLTVNPTDTSIYVRGGSAETYEAWLLALSETRPLGDRTQWRLKNFCAGSCDGSYFSAEVAVNRISVEVVKSEN